jgi:DNA invertase Pin-like site-specific DNA recombinase
MTECLSPPKNRVGRPRVPVTPQQVRALKNEGVSWRQIAKALKIGATTARRLFSYGEEIHR